MSIDACADLVGRGDPDRFAAVMAAPVAARPPLLVLYAFNLEVARAPLVSSQPLIAEMRLQFWLDALDAPRAHEVAAPLYDLARATPGLAAVLARLVEARMHDVARAPFANEAAFDAYVEDTSAGLMWAAALALKAAPEAETAFRALGWAQGLANYLRAVPDLSARSLTPLPQTDPAALRLLAGSGLNHLAIARAQRPLFGRAAPAALAAWAAGPLLKQAEANPTRIAEGTLALSEFSRRSRLIWMAATGRF